MQKYVEKALKSLAVRQTLKGGIDEYDIGLFVFMDCCKHL